MDCFKRSLKNAHLPYSLTGLTMRVDVLLAGACVCLVVGGAGVEASPCCGVLAAATVGGLAFAGARNLYFS